MARLRRIVHLAPIVLVAISLLFEVASDASCAPPDPVPQRIARADSVVFGRVISFEGGPIANRRALIVQVQRVYKGAAVERIFVSAGPGGEGGGASGVATSVDYQAEQGSEHTFYLKQHAPAGFSTDACSGSHPGDLDPDERNALGAGTAPEHGPGGAGSATALDRGLAVAAIIAALGATFLVSRAVLTGAR